MLGTEPVRAGDCIRDAAARLRRFKYGNVQTVHLLLSIGGVNAAL
jgi:hypothetical protein